MYSLFKVCNNIEYRRKSPFVYSGGINFTHGVASGDPFDTSVLLWVRAAPIGNPLPDQSVPICVSYTVWVDAGSATNRKAVTGGTAFTSYDVDWTVKVEASNLRADTKSLYQFADCTDKNTVSPMGKTRTLASPNSPFPYQQNLKQLY